MELDFAGSLPRARQVPPRDNCQAGGVGVERLTVAVGGSASSVSWWIGDVAAWWMEDE